MAAAKVAKAPRAGESLYAAYEQGHADWLRRRRRSIFLSSVWWVPALGALAVVAGALTRFPAFGVIVFVLGVAGVFDVAFRRPDRLIVVKTRASAEAATGRLLRYVEIRGGARVLHDRMVTGTAEPFRIEHLVICPRGVFLVDSKQWAGHGVSLVGRDLYVDKVDQGAVFKQLVDRAKVLGELLTGAAAADEEVGVVTVVPVVAQHGAKFKATPMNLYNVVLLSPEQLPPLLRRPDLRWSASATQNLVSAAELLLIRNQPEVPTSG
jgi:Nuclease-related domain